MKENIFKTCIEELKANAIALEKKIEEGLKEDEKEIRCLPTYIDPVTVHDSEKVLVLDLGGTNLRIAIVEFKDGKPVIHPKSGMEKKFEGLMKRKNNPCKRDEFYKEIADFISPLDLSGVTKIGYCFSYPCENMTNGDARLIKWTKGVTIEGMVGELMGETLLNYLNNYFKDKTEFKTIKVINDTIAALFSNISDTANVNIGLIVGTGTNMASIFPTTKVPKSDKTYTKKNIPG